MQFNSMVGLITSNPNLLLQVKKTTHNPSHTSRWFITRCNQEITDRTMSHDTYFNKNIIESTTKRQFDSKLTIN